MRKHTLIAVIAVIAVIDGIERIDVGGSSILAMRAMTAMIAMSVYERWWLLAEALFEGGDFGLLLVIGCEGTLLEVVVGSLPLGCE